MRWAVVVKRGRKDSVLPIRFLWRCPATVQMACGQGGEKTFANSMSRFRRGGLFLNVFEGHESIFVLAFGGLESFDQLLEVVFALLKDAAPGFTDLFHDGIVCHGLTPGSSAKSSSGVQMIGVTRSMVSFTAVSRLMI